MTATKTARKSVGAAEAENPVIEFLMARGMPYRRRMTIVMILALTGFGLQVVLLNVWVGLPLLIGALALTWVRGFDEKVDRRRPSMSAAWETAEVESIRRIVKLDRDMKSWDSSATDISSPLGALLFLLTLGGLLAGSFLLWLNSPELALIAGIDGALLLLPQWFNGMRFIQRRGDLVLKARHAALVLDRIGDADLAGGEMSARLRMVGREGERAPDNLKIAVTWPDGPEGFHGIQAQVVINRVQGTGHPYFYACIVANEGLGLLRRAVPAKLPHRVIVETETKDGVDVIVIRQHTTKNSGYHTDLDVSERIFRIALESAAGFVGQ